MPSFPRASVHVLIALAVTTCVVIAPFRAGDERAEALPAVAAGMHDAHCGPMSSTMTMTDHSTQGGMVMPTAAACRLFRPVISAAGWTATASSSAKGHGAGAALTGGSRTWWQSSSRPGAFRPQTLTLKTRTAKAVTGLKYQPASGKGAIARFEVRLSKDGRRFGAVVATGRWQRDSTTKQVGWAPTKVRAIRITIRSVSPARVRSVTAATISLTGVRPPVASSQPGATDPAVQVPASGGSAAPAPAPGQAASGAPGAPAPAPAQGGGTAPASGAAAAPAAGGDAAASPAPAGATGAGDAVTGADQAGAPVAAPGGGAAVESTSSEAVAGSWGPTIAFPLVPVAAAAIPGNRLVVWAADEDTSFGTHGDTGSTQTAVVDLTTGAVSATRVSNTGHDMFCPGVSMLADGRILVAGGISNAQTSIYDPKTDSWSAGPRMNIGRGYQSQTTLSDGRAFTVGGSWSGDLGGKVGEVYSVNGGWTVLPGVTADAMLTADAAGIFRSDNHMWLIATAGGKVLQAGPSKQMNWISTTGDGAVIPAGDRGDASDQMNGNAVLFDVNKVLTVGGATSYENADATGEADVLDLSGGYGNPVTVTKTAPLANPRSFANSVVLPDGEVLTIGGMQRPVAFSDAGSVLTPELWNPATGTWRSMADAAEPRNYHSVATLLPDGTVFSGGGGLCGAQCATNHPTGQIFSPPYLFNRDGSRATRPTIDGVPAAADPGQDVTVTASASASRFVLVRASSSTHSVDTDQRRVPLTVAARDGGDVTLSIPADNGVVLPGRYMLFALTADGVPSVSAPITIDLKG